MTEAEPGELTDPGNGMPPSVQGTSRDSDRLAHILHDLAGLLASLDGKLTSVEQGQTSQGQVEVPEPLAQEIAAIRHGPLAHVRRVLVKLREGDETICKEVFVLSGVIQSVIDSLKSSDATGVNIKFNPTAEVLVNADAAEIWRAVHNLLKNAIEVLRNEIIAKRKTLREVQINAFTTADNMVHITIEDNGPGIPPGLQKKLFEDGSTTKPGPGHGLGLSNVRKVAHQHGGNVSFESAPGKTVFHFVIPQGEVRRNDEHPEIPEKLRTGTQFIILEDDQTLNAMYETLLKERIGVQINPLIAKNFREFPRKVADLDPNLECILILDGNFPDGSPLDAIELMRGLKPDVKILFVSGSPPGEELKEQIDGVLLKPMNVRTFINSLIALYP